MDAEFSRTTAKLYTTTTHHVQPRRRFVPALAWAESLPIPTLLRDRVRQKQTSPFAPTKFWKSFAANVTCREVC